MKADLVLLIQNSKVWKRLAIFLIFSFLLIGAAPLGWEKIANSSESFLTAQSSKKESSRALDAVLRLPEVQQKAQEIQRQSNGKVRVKLMVESTPTLTESYYVIRVFEEHPERIVTLYWFRVTSPGEIITVQDRLTGEYISLEQWRGGW